MPFDYLYFDSLDPAQTVLMEELPRWFNTLPVAHSAAPPTFVCFRVEDGEDDDEVHAELRRWLHANGLPGGRRVTFAD